MPIQDQINICDYILGNTARLLYITQFMTSTNHLSMSTWQIQVVRRMLQQHHAFIKTIIWYKKQWGACKKCTLVLVVLLSLKIYWMCGKFWNFWTYVNLMQVLVLGAKMSQSLTWKLIDTVAQKVISTFSMPFIGFCCDQISRCSKISLPNKLCYICMFTGV